MISTRSGSVPRRRATGAKLVFDAHESYPDMMMAISARAVRMLRRHQRRLVPHADLLITVGPQFCEHYRQLGAEHEVVVGNWKDPQTYRFPPERLAEFRSSLHIRPEQIAVAFVANLGRDGHVEPLLEAVAGDARFAAVIGGTGAQEALVQRYAREHSNIAYLGRVPPEGVPLVTAGGTWSITAWTRPIPIFTTAHQ